ncbi:MAG: hypothetical protein MHMPM18_004444 [Marteilia pararefringens]
MCYYWYVLCIQSGSGNIFVLFVLADKNMVTQEIYKGQKHCFGIACLTCPFAEARFRSTVNDVLIDLQIRGQLRKYFIDKSELFNILIIARLFLLQIYEEIFGT